MSSSEPSHSEDSDSSLELCIVHRMGHSDMKLQELRRKSHRYMKKSYNDSTYESDPLPAESADLVTLAPTHGMSRAETEAVELRLLIKTHMYNSVNGFYRFIFVLVLVLPILILCQVCSVVSSSWAFNVCQGGNGAAIERGVFTSCPARVTASCPNSKLTVMKTSLAMASLKRFDSTNTDHILCEVSSTEAQTYTITLFACAALQFLCLFIMLVCTWRLFLRATRRRAMWVLFCVTVLSTCLGIVIAVLFSVATRCERQNNGGAPLFSTFEDSINEERRKNWTKCASGFTWGYKLYIGAVAMHGLYLFINVLNMRFLYEVNANAFQRLQEDRRRRWIEKKLRSLEVCPTGEAEGTEASSRTLQCRRRIMETHAPYEDDEMDGAMEATQWKPMASYLQDLGADANPWKLTVLVDEEGESDGQKKLIARLSRAPGPAEQNATNAVVGQSQQGTGGGEEDVNSSVGENEWEESPSLRRPFPYVPGARHGHSGYCPRDDGLQADDWVYDVKTDLLYSAKCDLFWDQAEQLYYNRHLQVWQSSPSKIYEKKK